MPKSKECHRKQFIAPVDLDSRLKEIEELISAILAMQFSDKLKKPLVKRALWLVAEVSGNFRGRFRSEGVLNELGAPIQRDHIYPRAHLLSELLAGRMSAADAVKNAQCCIVTKDEHKRLHRLPKESVGWERYERAKVTIRDMLTYAP